MRLLASATSTSRTGTPASAASWITAARSSASSSGRNLLKTGSSTTGATKLSSSTSSAAPIAATTGQDAGKITARADEPGHAQPGQHRADPDPLDAVERILPARLAREAERALVREPEPDRERQPDERREDDEERTEGERAERFGQGVDDPGERMSRRRERDEREECEPDREVGEDRAVARVVVPACGVRVDHGRGL